MELHLRKKDFRVDWFSGKGAGGQYRDRHANYCRITHLETGMVATGQSHRDRPSNQREAFSSLARRLVQRLDQKPERVVNTERVRTYHEVRNVVVDHASGEESSFPDVVQKARVQPLIEARKKALAAGEV